MDPSIEQLARDLAFAGYAGTTQSAYVGVAEEFATHCPRAVAQATREDVRAFVELLATRGRSVSWLCTKLSAIKFLFARTLGHPELVSFLKFPKVHSPLPTVLSVGEVHRLIQAIREPRYQAMAMVMYGAGLRIAEVIALQVRDIDGARGVLQVRHGKGDKAREVKLSPVLYQWLRRYWARVRPPLPYLFASPRTHKLPIKATLRLALAHAANEAGIKKPVHPHILRHSFATHLLDAGTDVHVVRALLGHTSITTTARYARVTSKRIQQTPSPLDLLPHR